MVVFLVFLNESGPVGASFLFDKVELEMETGLVELGFLGELFEKVMLTSMLRSP